MHTRPDGGAPPVPVNAGELAGEPAATQAANRGPRWPAPGGSTIATGCSPDTG